MRGSDYPVVVPTDLAAAAIRSGQKFEMKLPKEVHRITAKEKPAEFPVNADLLAKLKSKRMDIAEKAHIPAYLVFTDATLRDMCRRMPSTPEEFLGVSGVGRKKCESYGNDFLAVIKDFSGEAKKDGSPSEVKGGWTVDETERLRDEVEKGLSLTQISARHGRSANDIRKRLHETGILR